MKDSLHWKNVLDRLTRQHLDQVGKMLSAARRADKILRAVKRAARNHRKARKREREDRKSLSRQFVSETTPQNFPFEDIDHAPKKDTREG